MCERSICQNINLLYEICISVISVDINVDFKPQYHLVENAMTKNVNKV